MATKKIENALIILGIGALGYWWYKKYLSKKVVTIDPKMEVPKEQPQTIVLDLNKKTNSGLFPESMARDFNASKMATVSPARTTIKIN